MIVILICGLLSPPVIYHDKFMVWYMISERKYLMQKELQVVSGLLSLQNTVFSIEFLDILKQI